MEDTIKITAFLVFGLLGVVAIFSICWHQVKKKQMFGLFAQKKQMYKMEDKKKESFVKKIQELFTIKMCKENKELYRRFSKIDNMITDGKVVFFSAKENLGHYNCKNMYNPHIYLFMDTDIKENLFFAIKKDGKIKNYYPLTTTLDKNQNFRKIYQKIKDLNPKHHISVQIQNQKMLVMLQTLVVGGEKENDLNFLFEIYKNLS
jgi:hypothetical protein